MIITRLVYIVLLTLILISCSDSSDTRNQPIRSAEALTLAKNSGCLACHSIERKVVGPAWKDVSDRYANDPNAYSRLIQKVQRGGKGNWTDVTGLAVMPPYSPRVSDENIETLVSFILEISGNNQRGEVLTNIPVNADPQEFDIKQDEQPGVYFSTGIHGKNLLYKVEVIMVNGIIDLAIEHPVRQGDPVVVKELIGIDGQISYQFIATEPFYDLVITAKTDAIFTLAVSASEATFLSTAKTSGCFACHSILKKVVGPAWLDVSNRYRGVAGAETMLIEKVKKGGKGNWTDIVGKAVMPPYSPRVSDNNITMMVQEILKLE